MDFETWHNFTDDLTIRLFDHDHLWLHLVVHVVLVAMPTAFICIFLWLLYRVSFYRRSRYAGAIQQLDRTPDRINKIPHSVLFFVTRYSFKQQLFLGLGAILTLPVTYASLELPKRIINYGISAESFAESAASEEFSQVDYLLLLCGLFLIVLLLNSVLKYFVNYYKGSLAESLIRRLRVYIYHRKKNTASSDQEQDIVPVIIQEVEPVCGFSGDAFAVPLLQGGTALTIIAFMMVQNVALGAAAITLVPLQLLIIPRFQKKINALVQQRIILVRALSKNLSALTRSATGCSSRETNRLFLSLQKLRLKLFRVKYLSKAVNNFIMNLTPFFFYTIGGYLVIEGKLSVGALVASLASYKDLASSIREMFAYYQSYQDARVRYHEIHTFSNS